MIAAGLGVSLHLVGVAIEEDFLLTLEAFEGDPARTVYDDETRGWAASAPVWPTPCRLAPISCQKRGSHLRSCSDWGTSANRRSSTRSGGSRCARANGSPMPPDIPNTHVAEF